MEYIISVVLMFKRQRLQCPPDVLQIVNQFATELDDFTASDYEREEEQNLADYAELEANEPARSPSPRECEPDVGYCVCGGCRIYGRR